MINMLTKKKVQLLIIKRLEAVNGQCNEHYLNHHEGVFRGMLWVLTGKDPGSGLLYDTSDILELSEIKWEKRSDGLVHFDKDLDGKI